ncbi:HAD family hydrolase [Halobacteriales archaeon QH_10_70_21]|nr:MAG: HAD family hydrolase [Halobacteriales archaeon QH_10_70_21]
MSRFDAVLFDLDGTLCRRVQDAGAMYEAAFERAGVATFGEPAELWAALDGPPDPDDRVGYLGSGFARLAARYGRADADPLVLADHLTDCIDNTQVELVAGAEAALGRATATGRVGLLTNGPEDRQRTKVEALGVGDRFEVIVYAGDLPRRKPHAAPFERALAALETPADRALYVGNSLEYDVAGAHNAGLEAAWLRAAPDDGPGEYSPEYVLDSLEDLVDVLG